METRWDGGFVWHAARRLRGLLWVCRESPLKPLLVVEALDVQAAGEMPHGFELYM